MHCLGADPKYLIGKFPHSICPPQYGEGGCFFFSYLCREILMSNCYYSSSLFIRVTTKNIGCAIHACCRHYTEDMILLGNSQTIHIKLQNLWFQVN